jgi:glycerol-3-phosphate O-acyltransferase/dihydroxyacetone phosphate acyltransferase
MLWHIVKYYMGFVIATYFKRYKIKGAHHLKVKGPVIIAMNHPNGFMDPIAFTGMIYPPRVRYLARGDAFKKGLASMLLESLGIIPIYRIQDGGKEGLKKNDATYDRVNQLLKRRKKIIIFAEGLCIQERRLRPLKKGVPRMIFGAMESGEVNDLTVVPVGVNYEAPSQFRTDLLFNIGEPIKVMDYMASYKEAPAKTMNQFLADLTPRMKELIVHIEYPQTEKAIENMEAIYKYGFFKKEKLKSCDLESSFIFSTKVTEVITKAEENSPEKVKALTETSSRYLSELENLKLKPWLLEPSKQSRINYANLLFRSLVIIVTFPLYLRGLLGNYIPYKLTHVITSKKVKLVEFKASFSIGIGAVSLLLYYSLQYVIALSLAPNYWWALLVLLVSAATGMICIWLSPFRKKTMGIYRILKLRSGQPEVLNKLSEQHNHIIKQFEELV